MVYSYCNIFDRIFIKQFQIHIPYVIIRMCDQILNFRNSNPQIFDLLQIFESQQQREQQSTLVAYHHLHIAIRLET